MNCNIRLDYLVEEYNPGESDWCVECVRRMERGSIHREDGPTRIEYYSSTPGSIYRLSWYQATWAVPMQYTYCRRVFVNDKLVIPNYHTTISGLNEHQH